jgi:hypothetical protein
MQNIFLKNLITLFGVYDNEFINVLVNIYIYIYYFKNNNIDIHNIDKLHIHLTDHFFNDIKQKFNFEIIKISLYDLELLFNNDYSKDLELLFNTNFNLNEIIYHNLVTIKQFKLFSKEFKLLFTRQKTINHINDIINNFNLNLTSCHFKSILNLFSGTGSILSPFFQFAPTDNITLCDINSHINIISHFYMHIVHNINLTNNIIQTDLIHDNIINGLYDLIIADIPDNIKKIGKNRMEEWIPKWLAGDENNPFPQCIDLPPIGEDIGELCHLKKKKKSN